MPIYEYRCPECTTTFELRRPAELSSAPASCPEGHEGARRRLSVFTTPARSTAPAPAGGCGAGCACAAAAH
ncbi:MAG TPA: zinc ribbon domain-containing protein [Acidimicrobiales bacterium]|nr:zinc ribbon domain-containing protein [Acidimicrobiales bacterium]